MQSGLFKMRADLECSNLAFKFLFSYSGFTVFFKDMLCLFTETVTLNLLEEKKYCEILAQAQLEAQIFYDLSSQLQGIR